MKIKLGITLIFLLLGISLKEHNDFYDTIEVRFERKINQKKVVETYYGSWGREMMNSIEKYYLQHFTFKGNTHHGIYYCTDEEAPKSRVFWSYNPFENKIYHQYDSGDCVYQKFLFEEQVLIKDSLKKYDWVITNEARNIAGYECRKAYTILYDSVVVFAFYAQELLCQGGPENFRGLPGMILGIAIPKLFLTCMATEVKTRWINLSEVKAPKKGKVKTYEQTDQMLTEAMASWRRMNDFFIWLNSL